MTCPQCSKNNEEGSGFCDNCGAALESASLGKSRFYDLRENSGFVTNIENKVYFKIARGFAWLILFLATLSLIGSIVYLTKKLPSIIGGNTDVTKVEVQRALTEEESGRTYDPGQVTESKIDIDMIKKLDSEITDVIYLFPDDVRRNERTIDELRRILKNSLSYWRNINDRISIIRSLKKEMQGFTGDTNKTLRTMLKFIEIKKAKEESIKVNRAQAMVEIWVTAGTILSMIIIITLGSLVLVLMAIERNTRKW